MSSDIFSLAGRRALVTGANSGIGRALALGLAAQGADLVLHHLGDAGGAIEVSRKITEMGRNAAIMEADFTRSSAVDEFAENALIEHGPIDILIANAAIEYRGAWQTLTDDHIATHVAVNFASLLTLVRKMVPAMVVRNWGRVIAIGSILATRPRAETVVYASLKAAQLTAVRTASQ